MHIPSFAGMAAVAEGTEQGVKSHPTLSIKQRHCFSSSQMTPESSYPMGMISFGPVKNSLELNSHGSYLKIKYVVFATLKVSLLVKHYILFKNLVIDKNIQI